MTAPNRVRVRKARHRGTCPRCRRLVLPGELIASIGGGPFICIEHVTRQDTDQQEDTIMSNRRKLKLRPATLPYTPAATDVGLDQPGPDDRCEFHPGCCDPDDMTCQGVSRHPE